MTEVQPLGDADSMTDWVIETASQTGINSYALWELAEALSEGNGKTIDEISATLSPEAADEVDEILDDATMHAPDAFDAGHENGESDAPVPDEPDLDSAPKTDAFDWSAIGAAGVGADDAIDHGRPGTGGENGDRGVSQDEYERFQHQVKETIQGLIDFLISYDMLGDGSAEVDDDVVAEFRRLTSEFEDDVDAFFDRIDKSIDAVDRGDAPEDADEMEATVQELREAVSELRDATSRDDRDRSLARFGEDGRGLRSDADVGDDRTLRRQLGRLNRLLDERVELTDHERDQHAEYGYDEQLEAAYESHHDGGMNPSYGRNAPVARDESSSRFDGADVSRAGLAPIDFAWLAAGLTYGGTDMFSTALVIGEGGTELNPVFDLLGGTLAGFVLWKTFVLMLLFVFFYPDDPELPSNLEWYVPMIVIGAGVVLTTSNLMQVF